VYFTYSPDILESSVRALMFRPHCHRHPQLTFSVLSYYQS